MENSTFAEIDQTIKEHSILFGKFLSPSHDIAFIEKLYKKWIASNSAEGGFQPTLRSKRSVDDLVEEAESFAGRVIDDIEKDVEEFCPNSQSYFWESMKSYCEQRLNELEEADKSNTLSNSKRPIELCLDDYSLNSFVVYGETKQIKEELKRLGGKYNPNLTLNNPSLVKSAWIFSKNSKVSVLEALRKLPTFTKINRCMTLVGRV